MTHLKTLSLAKRASRRSILKALGVSAAAAPFIPALDGWAAGSPQRLLTVFSPHGVIPETFWPSGTETTFTFPAGGILEPLAAHKGDMIIFKGLKRPTRGPGEHERCGGNLWTGTALAAGSQDANGPSVDQIVAKAVGGMTEFQSLQFGAQTSYWGEGDIVSKLGSVNTSLIYTAARARIYPELDPEKVFARIFASSTGVGDMGSVERTRAERQSILDFVKGEIGSLQGRLASEDRVKIDAHLALTRDVERRLQMPARSCGAVENPGGGIDLGKNENFPKIIQVMNRLLIAALACDRTRVASMQYSRSFSMHRHTWVNSKEGHHTVSHNSGAKAILTAIQRWYMVQIGDLLTGLKAVQELGKPMLDNMLVVYGSELCTPWDHNAEPPPNMWFGKLGGTIPRTGRYIDFAGRNDHNQYLVTICHAMGATTVNKVGDLGGEGRIPGILA